MKTIGEKYNEALEEIHDGFWEHDQRGIPFEFPPEAIRNAAKIMMSVTMDRLWKDQEAKGYAMEIRGKQAEALGKEFHALIKKWTLVDLHNFYK